MWSLNGKALKDCQDLREILYAKYSGSALVPDDPDVISAFDKLDKFLLGKGLSRDDVTFDMWTGTIWLKAEVVNGDLAQYRIDNGFIS